jgi:hypothetical protein
MKLKNLHITIDETHWSPKLWKRRVGYDQEELFQEGENMQGHL